MSIRLTTPGVDDLGQVLGALRSWQLPGAPVQLHPGDVGWFWRHGPEATAAALRVWTAPEGIRAVGLLDGPDLLRVGLRPDAQDDRELAERVVADVSEPARGVLPEGEVAVETPSGALVHDLLGERGWGEDEPWAVLRRDLARPVADPGMPVETVDAGTAEQWAQVHRLAFGGTVSLEDTLTRWHRCAQGEAWADARCLLLRDGDGAPVAGIIVWTAGPGRVGVVEPMGVHPEHRGRGHGRAVTLAGEAALRDLGAAAAVVATPLSNTGGVATYTSAGFERLPDRRDRRRG
ncbi:Acetyltransferase [Serinicoccus hydrothermalis]|uniref:Acetyltransferase n=1 Tax=Serinicoccus hydrothermalis TaxID=1758689 RepID=A0A1B1NDY4_9MICO|nr:GNAT family N-acetyltransferase [Serinicoccus hydrothermalis]ANS79647.1 Acetyltransferase [Serinicoccus hydrothermalis]